MIGLYDGECCGSFHLEPALTCMRQPYRVFSDEDILRPGFGEDLSILVFGAGYVSDSPTALGGNVGRQRIRDLVKDGRDYVGVCAGSYLALLQEPKGLGLAGHVLEYPQAANIFQGFLTVECEGDSAAPFPVWYQNGPVFRCAEGEVLARFSGERLPDIGPCLPAPPLTALHFAGRPAAAESQYGKGRCVCLSPHLELGSLGLPGFWAFVEAWMAEHFPEELKAHPNRVPTGRSRRAFLAQALEAGFEDQLQGPQWSMLKALLTRSHR